MLLAQAKELVDVGQRTIQSAEAYGLIGYLLVAVLLVIVAFFGAAFKFFAPLVTKAVVSTVELHSSIKETNLRLAVTLDKVTDEQSNKLSDIRELVEKLAPCPYAKPNPPPLPQMPQNISPLPHGA